LNLQNIGVKTNSDITPSHKHTNSEVRKSTPSGERSLYSRVKEKIMENHLNEALDLDESFNFNDFHQEAGEVVIELFPRECSTKMQPIRIVCH